MQHRMEFTKLRLRRGASAPKQRGPPPAPPPGDHTDNHPTHDPHIIAGIVRPPVGNEGWLLATTVSLPGANGTVRIYYYFVRAR